MPLDRLLSVVVLTPAQASLVAVRLLDAIHLWSTTNGVHRTGTCVGAVTLTPSGDVDVTRPLADEGTPVTGLLEQLSQNARRLPAHPRPEQLVLLRRLEEAAADPQPEPGAAARELEGALAEVLGSGAPQRLSGQLAALVDAFCHIAPSFSVPVDAPVAPAASRSAPHPTAPHRAAPARSTPSRPPRRGRALRHRRAWTRRMAVVALLLTAVTAGSGYLVLRNPDVGVPGALGGDGPSSASPTTEPSDSAKQQRPDPRPGVQALAGRHAGPITGVEVQQADSCTPGAPCPVTVTVHFRPASTIQPVVWKVGAARLCTSGITWSPPITVTAQPGWTTVYASSSVSVPQGRSLALVALTTSPARAQSRPVPVTGSSLRC